MGKGEGRGPSGPRWSGRHPYAVVAPCPDIRPPQDHERDRGFGQDKDLTSENKCVLLNASAFLVLLYQLSGNPLRHGHDLTRQQLLSGFEPKPVADLAMDLRQ